MAWHEMVEIGDGKEREGKGVYAAGVGSKLKSKTIHGSREQSIRRTDQTSLCRHLTF